MSAQDPYGIDLAFDPTGDLRVTHSGALGLVAGTDNAAQAIFLRLKTPQGDLALHPDYGSQLAGRLIGAKMNVVGVANQLNSELQSLPADDPRFTSAQISQIQQPASTGSTDSMQIAVQAQLAGGETLTLDNTSDPTTSDVSLPGPIDSTVDPTITFDPTIETEFFADQPELDALNDINAQQSMIDDTPGASIIGTTGEEE